MGYQKSHALIQCRWDGPISTTSKEEIKAHREKAKMEHASFTSFNHTSHLLNITLFHSPPPSSTLSHPPPPSSTFHQPLPPYPTLLHPLSPSSPLLHPLPLSSYLS